MNIASVVWTWQESGRLYSRITTNARTERLLTRLTTLGLLQLVETIHSFFGDRAEGGNGYEVAWKTHVEWRHLQAKLPRL